jgi:hypothetical protein
VSGELPEPSGRLASRIAAGAALVILVPPGEPAQAELRRRYPDAQLIEDARYARALDSRLR